MSGVYLKKFFISGLLLLLIDNILMFILSALPFSAARILTMIFSIFIGYIINRLYVFIRKSTPQAFLLYTFGVFFFDGLSTIASIAIYSFIYSNWFFSLNLGAGIVFIFSYVYQNKYVR